MKYYIALIVFCFTVYSVTAQKIVNVVLVSTNGITEDIKEATSFIVVKKYPNNFIRLDYKKSAPLVKARTYSDSSLTVLEGKYYEYAPDGSLAKSGYYGNNLKEKDWFYYNDTGKVILKEKCENGFLVNTINPDTVKKDSVSDKLQDGEKEATYKNSVTEWTKYLGKTLDADVAAKSKKGGTVRVGFTVNTDGKCVDVFMRKSVEFILDEEALRVIENSPLWNPAIQKGKKVNAYRIQPISFMQL